MRALIIAVFLSVAILVSPTFAGSINNPVIFPLTLPGTGNTIDAKGNITANTFMPTGGTCSGSFTGLYLISANNWGLCSNGTDTLHSANTNSIVAQTIFTTTINGNNGLTIMPGGTSGATLATGNQSAASTAAANLNITAGNATGTGGTSNGGSVVITPGTSTNGTAGTIQLMNLTTGTNADFLCLSSGGAVLIQSSACTISSLRFKPDWKPYSGNSAMRLVALQVGTFSLHEPGAPNPDPNARAQQIGLNAENVAKVAPKCAIYENDMKTPKSYRQECVIALLVSGFQEQQKEIAALSHANDNSWWHRIGVIAGLEK